MLIISHNFYYQYGLYRGCEIGGNAWKKIGYAKKKRISKFFLPGIGASQLGIRAQVSDYLGARVGVSTSVFGYWLFITKYRELCVQNN